MTSSGTFFPTQRVVNVRMQYRSAILHRFLFVPNMEVLQAMHVRDDAIVN